MPPVQGRSASSYRFRPGSRRLARFSCFCPLRPAVAANLNTRVENVVLGIDLEIEFQLEVAVFLVGAQKRVGRIRRTAADDFAVFDLVRSVAAALRPAVEVLAVEQLNLLVGENAVGETIKMKPTIAVRRCVCIVSKVDSKEGESKRRSNQFWTTTARFATGKRSGAWGNASESQLGRCPEHPRFRPLIRDADSRDQRVVHADVVARDAGDFDVAIEDVADLELCETPPTIFRSRPRITR